MRILPLIALLAALALAACGKPDACAGLPDGQAVDRVAAAYDREPATEKGDAAQMQFARGRVLGIGRGAGPDGKALAQVWFRQDDRTLTVGALTADCKVSFRPGLASDAIDAAVFKAQPPRF